MSRETYEDCGASSSSQTVKLLDCSQSPQSSEFILKVSQFSEIPYSPHFRENDYVYFLGQHDLCSIYNLRIAAKLVSDKHVNNNNSDNKELSTLAPKLNAFTTNDKGTTSNIIISDTYKLNPHRADTVSAWMRYRFLLIPASLGFLTLIGIQAVICALWHPKQSSRCRICCSYNVVNKPNDDIEDTEEVSKTPIKLLEKSLVGKPIENHKRQSIQTSQLTIQPILNGQFRKEYFTSNSKQNSNIPNAVQDVCTSDKEIFEESSSTVQMITDNEIPILTMPTSQASLSNNNYNVQFYTCPYSIDGNLTCLVPVKVNKSTDIFSTDMVNLGSVINISV
ncbi:coiled coil domain-containing protein isoform 1 [Schistosoma japonicum]|nr:coiled coil domain-containing protein [Schistosoma japonicum]KAH8854100.1 coiled coil domain-containing protein [Schistosoma japonicum]KAH8854101.1 coiled coil domain-containing protein [Schistosoma japonicum]TNN20794.1 coiled coil domain-containing protein isoform 1 [Schistosoma japonicum]